ncbi:MAG: hypothetical protein U0174_06030 [Polyangiaceae bacterium]
MNHHRPRSQTMPLIFRHIAREVSDAGIEVDWDDNEASPASQAYERPQRMRGWETDEG